MPKYIINKASRYYSGAYSGPTCAEASVEQGKIYDDYEEAIADAARLSKHNKVGFDVIEAIERSRNV